MRFNPKSIRWVVLRAMPRIKIDVDADLNVWNVERNDNGLWLNNTNGNPDYHRDAATRFVFRSRNSLHFSSGFLLEEFCFASCPYQPPAILPIYSSGTEGCRGQ
jgi:hypothetical protein